MAGRTSGTTPRDARGGAALRDSLADIAARSMCPTCEGREPEPGEEDYACCFFCFLTPPALPSLSRPVGAPVPAPGDFQADPHEPAQAPAAHIADVVPLKPPAASEAQHAIPNLHLVTKDTYSA